jgi:hypothetical protein
VVPAAKAVAVPTLVGELLTVAVAGVEELQITDCSVCVLPSLNVPVATNCWDCPCSHSPRRMTPAELRKIGEALYGKRWQTKFAARIKVDPRTVRRWLSGDRKIRPQVEAHIRTLRPE